MISLTQIRIQMNCVEDGGISWIQIRRWILVVYGSDGEFVDAPSRRVVLPYLRHFSVPLSHDIVLSLLPDSIKMMTPSGYLSLINYSPLPFVLYSDYHVVVVAFG